MIDYTQLRHLLNHTVHTKAALNDETKAAFVKYKEAFLSQMNKGDLLEGKLLKGTDLGFILQLKDGIEIPVKLEGHLIMGRLMTFIVEDLLEGAIQLKPYEEPSLNDKVIDVLKLPENPEMKRCIDAFVENELPLDKEMLFKSYVLHKEIKIPYPVIMNLIEKLGGEAKSFLVSLQTYKAQELLEGIETFRMMMVHNKQEHQGEWLSNQVKWCESLEGCLSKQLLESMVKEIDREGSGQGISLADEEKAILLKLIQQSQLGIKEEPWMQTTLMQHPEKLLLLARKLYDEIFTFSNMKLRQLGDNGLSGKELPLFEGYENLLKCLEKTEEMTLTKGLREEIGELQESLNKGFKLQTQGHYFVYPFEMPEKKEEAIVYFYKPKKKADANKRDYFAVIALDLPHIDHIEIHIHQIDKDLAIDFFVEEKSVGKCIEAQFEKLREKLLPLGYTISKWGCHLKNTKETKVVEDPKAERVSLDLRV